MRRISRCGLLVVRDRYLSRRWCQSQGSEESSLIKVVVRAADGAKYVRFYADGDNLMEAMRDDTDLPLDMPGACNGTSQCSTCQVQLLSSQWFDKVASVSPQSEAELDCLDKAVDSTELSRLSCQVKLSRALNGLEVQLPRRTVDVRWQAAYKRSVKK